MRNYLYAYEYFSIWCCNLILLVGGLYLMFDGRIFLGLGAGVLFGIAGAFVLARRMRFLTDYIAERKRGKRPTDAIGTGRLIIVPYVLFPALIGAIAYELITRNV
jgi:MFS family permease